MKSSKALVLAVTVALGAGVGAARADTLYTVDAVYEPFILADTTITVENISGSTETDVELSSGGISHLLGDLAPGASASYEFNDPTGPFINGAANTGLPDTTTYQVTADYSGTTVSSGQFSPLSNLTGGYVDFLGSCWAGASGGCPDESAPDGAEVAEGDSPVPLSPSLLFLFSGCTGLLGFARAAARRA